MNYKQTSTKELVTYSLIIYPIKMYTHTNLCISDFCHFGQIERHHLHYHMHHASIDVFGGQSPEKTQ